MSRNATVRALRGYVRERTSPMWCAMFAFGFGAGAFVYTARASEMLFALVVMFALQMVVQLLAAAFSDAVRHGMRQYRRSKIRVVP